MSDYASTGAMRDWLFKEHGFEASTSTVNKLRVAAGLKGRVTWEKFLEAIDNGRFVLKLKRRGKVDAETWTLMDRLLAENAETGQPSLGEIARRCEVSLSLVSRRRSGERGPKIS